MGLFDAIAGQVVGALTNSGNSGAAGGLMEAIGGLINNPQTGGLTGLISAFEQKGLGSVVQSWIGTGQNASIAPDQLHAVLGSDQLQAIASKLGLPIGDITNHLAQFLPQIINQITPNGSVPHASALDDAMGMLKGFMK